MKNFGVLCLILVLFSVANAVGPSKPLTNNQAGKPSSSTSASKNTEKKEGAIPDIRYNYNLNVFKTIDKQINKEYEAMYFYEKLASQFIQPTIGKRGFSKFFRSMANEELEHARKLTQYVTDRGMEMTSSFTQISPVNTANLSNVTEAITGALKKEMEINESLLKLHKEADTAGDPHLQDFLETNYLDEQVKSIRDLRIMLSRLVNSDNQKDIAFLMDQELLRS